MRSRVYDLIEIDTDSSVPKYMQLVNSIVSGIEMGKIKRFDHMPSIHQLSYTYDISKATIEKGYNHLRKIGILESVQGKGFFIKSIELSPTKIFLLFNKLSAHKKIIYDSFIEGLHGMASVDLHIYNNCYESFKRQLLSNAENYSFYVIIPHFLEKETSASAVINSIPKERLVLLDKKLEGVRGEFAAIYENFEKDIYQALEQALERLRKYRVLKIIFPAKSYYPNEIVLGFISFCRKYDFRYAIIDNLLNEEIQNGDVYINLAEDDLIILIDKISAFGFDIGKDVGIISYNETPFKKFMLNGITTISTNFMEMGRLAADSILSRSAAQIEVPFQLTLRRSL